jgi:ribonucleoside-diphosphate reductase beta chain
MTIFDSEKTKYTLKSKMFLDEAGGVNIARYDEIKYKEFDKLFEKQLGFFWRPQEVDLTKDVKDFRDLTPHQQHIFTSNLKRQILLDSVQGRGPVMLLPIISIPELEPWIIAWTFSEQIHSKSYTHIIRNIYSNPSIIFDEILSIKEVVDCAKDVSKYYDDLNDLIIKKQVAGDSWTQEDNYSLKKALWLCLHSINALEGVRFYVSFACSWSFGELKLMEGNAKIIKFIARDENLHLASTQQMLKLLPSDDSDFVSIKEECKADVEKMFVDVVNQEKAWADYLFKDGSMIGLNAEILKQYVEWIAHKRMKAVDLDSPFKVGSNPLPWTQKWIAGDNVQPAPQETEISSYIVGGIKQDISENSFTDIEL